MSFAVNDRLKPYPKPEKYVNISNFPSAISVMYTNARSLVNKIDLLRSYVFNYKPMVICITETWGTPDIPDVFFDITGYQLFRCDRTINKGGGVIIYVFCELKVHLFSKFAFDGAEAITAKVHGLDRSIVLSCVYKPPHYKLSNSNLLAYLNSVCNIQSDDLVICGDFNCPNVDWTRLNFVIPEDPLHEWCMDNFLRQHVNESTRPESQSTLDLVFASSTTAISQLSIDERFGKSDHSIISFNVQFLLENPSHNLQKIFVFSRAQWRVFRTHLQNSRWPSLKNSSDVNQLWNVYLKNIQQSLIEAVPVGFKHSWTPLKCRKVRTALRHQRRCNTHYKNDPSTENQVKLAYSNNIVEKKIQEAQISHEKQLSSNSSTNPRAFWGYCKGKLKTKTYFPTMVSSTGELVSDSKCVADYFNETFSSYFNNSSQTFIPSPNEQLFRIDNVLFTPTIVHDCILKLQASSSCDSDGLNYLAIKKGGLFLATKLSYLFNQLMTFSCIPDSWRQVVVCPIFKSGSKSCFNNYRPVTISTCICRIMERIISKVILDFCSSNELLFPTQHGFLPCRSTETAGLVFFDSLTKAIDVGHCVDVTFLDYSHAFDSVPHHLILSKLHSFGITGNLLSWITNYFLNRSQVVRVNGVLSDPKQISSGILQGSALGPLLFVIYLNDVDKVIRSAQIIKYADDIKLTVAYDPDNLNSCNQLQHDINSVYSWSHQNGLSININKSKNMYFGRRNPKCSYHVDDHLLDQVVMFRDLGVNISTPFSFKAHIYSITSKANQILGMIQKVFYTRDKSTMTLVYKSHVRSILEYSSILWNPYHIYAIDHIEKVQRRFTRLFPDLRCQPYRQRLKALGLLSLNSRRLRYRLIFLYKLFNGHIDVNFDDFFHLSTRPSRANPFKIVKPFAVHDYRSKFFTVDIIDHWNRLSPYEVCVDSVPKFKQSIEKYFFRMDIW